METSGTYIHITINELYKWLIVKVFIWWQILDLADSIDLNNIIIYCR